jgi:hypothetical protein
LIGGQKNPALGDVPTPFQSCGQLQRVRGPQIVSIHELRSLGAQRVGRLYHKPSVGKRGCQPPSLRTIGDIDLLHAH